MPNKQPELGMALYHLDPRWVSFKEFDQAVDWGVVNSYRFTVDSCGTAIYGAQRAMESNSQIWLGAPIYFHKKESLADYMKNIERIKGRLEKGGVWDAVTGFQWDEPLLKAGHTNDDFLAMTKAIYEAYGKRIFPVWSLYEVCGRRVGNDDDPSGLIMIQKDATKYVTDVGFDVYGYDFRKEMETPKLLNIIKDVNAQLNINVDNTTDLMREYTRLMLDLTYRDDAKVWYFPCTYLCGSWGGGKTDEDYCVSHVENFKKLLFEQKHPGGLFGYTYKTWETTSIALDHYLDRENPERWVKLEKVLKDTCKEFSGYKSEK